MKIIFSNPLLLHRVGAGNTYGQLYDALMRQKRHEIKFISGYELVKNLYSSVPNPPESLEQGTMSDVLASFEDLSGEVFLGAGCASLDQIRARRNDLSGSTRYLDNKNINITTWFSSHYAFADKVLTQEYKEMGLKGQAIDPYHAFRNKIEQKWCDAIIVAGEHCAKTYEASDECKGKVHTVNFGVDSKIYYPSDDVKDDQFKIVYSGGNWIRKGLRYLLTAWHNLNLEGTLTVMSVTPNTFPPLKNTNYAGWVSDTDAPALLRNNSVFCLPSLEEGQALVVLEAMASGLPVIVTEETGAPIEDGKEGLFVPSKNVEKLRDAIQYFYDNPSEVIKMGHNARVKAESLTWDLFGKQVLRVCESVQKK